MAHAPSPRFSGTFAAAVRPSVPVADHRHISQSQKAVSSWGDDRRGTFHVLEILFPENLDKTKPFQSNCQIFKEIRLLILAKTNKFLLHNNKLHFFFFSFLFTCHGSFKAAAEGSSGSWTKVF